MIYFDSLPLSEDIKKALMELKIDYVFQSIFYPDGKTVYAREALMRPYDMTVTELIKIYEKMDKLHVLEVATFFGATQKYFLRSYKELLSINSFPCEIFTKDEVETYIDYYGTDKRAMIIECLEYPEFSEEMSLVKRKYADINNNLIAIDDYGTGFNDIHIVELVNPDIVKIDRTLLSGIDTDKYKQANCSAIIETMHAKNLQVVAEGIETEAEFEYMKSIGADLFQGYYLGMPE
ncbi:MAG: EAL domain-containing protein [Lachnospiraceae bacterium]|nr:EAL domain-containing protein [Lachnospiraceae bacterium]